MKKLLNIQKEIKAIKKASKNPFFNSMYFDINKLLEALKPLLNEEGLLVMQPLTVSESGVNVLKTLVIDPESGDVLMKSAIALPSDVDPQKMGSAITYYRRYSLQSMFLLEAEDDDANSTVPETPSLKAAPEAPKYSEGGKGQCLKCGADNVMSAKGNIHCSAYCWKN